jgi:hypothetical protein
MLEELDTVIFRENHDEGVSIFLQNISTCLPHIISHPKMPAVLKFTAVRTSHHIHCTYSAKHEY